jgi:F-box and leucine-rich repeat protein 10/11
LNEGVVRATDEGYQHHYIKPIKEGAFNTLPESFPRMRPELVTARFFERCGEFAEPIVIPAEWNQRPASADLFATPEQTQGADVNMAGTENDDGDDGLDYEYVPEHGQDKLDMVIPQGLTVRRVSELYGPEQKVEIIDVKSQEGGDKRWNMRKWADYYEQEGEKPVRNVISLEVSKSKLGRLIRRPRVVRDLDLQDSVWPQDEASQAVAPAVQFYCLMSVADCYTDFHVDFGGSSVYYHILKGKKTFFFIPPKKQHLKKYEEWCLSPQQNWTWLPDHTKECYRIDLSEGDTMLIPSGWIHSVWTPENSLVIGGNFLTRLHLSMQLRIFEIEKATKVPRKFRYPHFQKVLWYTVIKYLQEDALPQSVAQEFYSGKQFKREIPIYCQPNKFGHNSDPGPENYNARYYPKSELDGLPELAQFVFRTVMISLGRVEGVTAETRNAVNRSIPKGFGDPLEIVKTFAIWAAWKRGNEDIPQWAHPDAVLPEQTPGEKKLSQAALKRLDRQAAIDAYRVAPDRQSARQKSKALELQAEREHAAAAAAAAAAATAAANAAANAAAAAAQSTTNSSSSASQTPKASAAAAVPATTPAGKHLSTPKTSVLGPKRIACDACRRRRIRCKHKDELVTIGSPDQNGIPSASTPNSTGKRQNSTLMAVVVDNSPKDQKQMADKVNKSATSPSQRNVPIFDGADDTPDGKRGRTKACADCRKSKVRIHASSLSICILTGTAPLHPRRIR